jgi:protease IV
VAAEPGPKRTKTLRRIGLAILVVLALAQIRHLAADHPFGNAVALVELRGVIEDTADLIEDVDRLRTDPQTVAVVLRIDSPGGAVAPSQELHAAVLKLRDAKPVVASFGNVAASGGYYVAVAATQIFAAPGSLTGSIGAIMSLGNYQTLAEKIGVTETVIKSGRFKDLGHPLRAMAPDERALLQRMVDDILTQFVDAVATGRKMDPEKVRALADGRIFSGAQAHAEGLVDELGGLSDAVAKAWSLSGQQGEPQLRRLEHRRWPRWITELTESRWLSPPLGGGLFFLYGGGILQ